MDLASQKPAEIFLPWQDDPQISKELGIHQSTPINGAVICGCRGRCSQHPKKDPDRWSAADKFTVVVETAGFNTTELSSYCRERAYFQNR